MGVIKKQSIGYSIVNYLGVAIGALSLILLYPRDEKIYGLFRFLVDTANVILPFATLGMSYVCIRMFPIFQDKKTSHHGFLAMMTIATIIGSVLLSIVFFLLKDYIFDVNKMKDGALFARYIPAIIPIFFFFGYTVLLRAYCTNFYKLVFPSAVDQLIKISFPSIFILFLLKIIDLDQLVIGVILHYFMTMCIMIFYLNKLGEFSLKTDFAFLDKKLLKQFLGFSLYGVVGYGSTMLALRIDTAMVSWMLGDLKETGIFGISTLIGSNIALPLSAVAAIASPIIVKAWKENDLEEVAKIYRKSSENLLLIGLFLFCGVCLCLNEIFAIMPQKNDYSTAKFVVLMVGVKSVIDMATGTNDIIIGYSKYYKFSIVAIIIMAIMNIIGNFIFIPRYGIVGAAMATFFSSVIFNLSKFIFIYLKFKMNPYTKNSFKTLIISALCFGITYYLALFLPEKIHPIFSILIKGGLFTLMFGAATLRWDASEDITLVKQQIFKFLNKFRKP